jgi:membrane protease YdiL (CAAX protease family)
MNDNNSVDLNRLAKRHFTIIGVSFLLYEVVLIYEKYFVNPERITSIADRFNFTYESIDLVYSGALVVCVTIVILGIIMGEYLKKPLNYIGEEIKIKNVLFFTLLIISLNLIGSYISTIFSNYTSINNAYLIPIGVVVDRFDFYSPIYMLLVLLIFPIIEEFLFRKALLNLLKRYGFRFAVIVSSMIFALAHNNIFQILAAFLIAVVLCIITLQYNSVIPAILAHILNNVFFYIPFIINPRNYWILVIAAGLILVLTIYGLLKPDKITLTLPTKVRSNNYNIFFKNIAVVLMMALFIVANVYFLFI